MRSKIVTAAEAAAKVKDGDFIATCGVNTSGGALEVMEALAERYKTEGKPKISLMHAGGSGIVRVLAESGMIDTYYSGLPIVGPEFVDGNAFPTFGFAQGIAVQAYRAQAADFPFLTKAGLNTFIDPRQDGGAVNEKAREMAKKKPVVELHEVDGEEYLHIKLPPITVALIRATTGDADGNLSDEDESIKHELLQVAMAAHNHGGIVIAQVRRVAQRGTMLGADVVVPGMLVDYVVPCSDPEKYHTQNGGYYRNDCQAGKIRVDECMIPVEDWAPQGNRKIITRRAVMELRPGKISLIGMGLPDGVTYHVAKEHVYDLHSLCVELGAIGGITGGGYKYFSAAFNPTALIRHSDMFDFINGHGMDTAFLGAAEIGEDGSVNVTKLAGRVNGSGGFVNIAAMSKKIVFCTTFTQGGKFTTENGKLKIIEEGRPIKLIKQVSQISYNGPQAAAAGRDVVYVTERAVFRRINGKITLVEYADGLDIEKDIIALMGFRPEISPDLKTIPEICYTDEPLGLRKQWLEELGEEE